MKSTALLILTLTLAVSAKQQSGAVESSANAAHKAADAMKSLTANPVQRPGHQDNPKPDVDEDEYAGAPAMIRGKCRREWPDDFEMQAHCEKQQNEAVEKLKRGKPEDILVSHYQVIHSKCRKEWPDDFEMRAYCENKQFDALRKLRDR